MSYVRTYVCRTWLCGAYVTLTGDEDDGAVSSLSLSQTSRESDGVTHDSLSRRDHYDYSYDDHDTHQ